jgi:plastocyanin
VTFLHRWIAPLAGAAALVAVPVPVAAAGKTFPVVLQQLAFGPTPARLKVGDVIEWVNNDIFVHSATARDKSFDVELKPKARVRMTLSKPGTFDFICRYHPGMKGRLVVAR